MDLVGLREFALRHGIQPQLRRRPDASQEITFAVSGEEAKQLRVQLNLRSSPIQTEEVGVFYIVRLVPELDGRRILIGFDDSSLGCLKQIRMAAPSAGVVKSWPCKRSWVQVVIDCLSPHLQERLSGNVYECDDIERLRQQTDAVFSFLPDPRVDNAMPLTPFPITGRRPHRTGV